MNPTKVNITMTEPADLTIKLLQQIRTDIAGVKEDLRQVNYRLESMEDQARAANHNFTGAINGINRRMDGWTERFTRIETRLYLPELDV
jgi:hypothetical protein